MTTRPEGQIRYDQPPKTRDGQFRAVYGRPGTPKDSWQEITGYATRATMSLDEAFGGPVPDASSDSQPIGDRAVLTETPKTVDEIVAIVQYQGITAIRKAVPTAQLRDLKPELIGRDAGLDEILKTL